MAEFQFLAPKPLTGADLPPEWESFKEDFNQFLIAIEKDGADDKVKLALLLRTIGERGKDIYKGLVFPTGKSKDKYNDVIAQMDAFCKPRLNLFNTRDYFLTCRQNGGTVDEYLTELRKRGRNCDFGDQLDTLILHTLVLGLDDTNLISYSGHQLIPAGKAYANVEDAHGDKAQLEFYIVPRGFKAVIGGNDCLSLGLITRTDNTSEPNSEASVPIPAQAKLNQQVSYEDSANCPPKPRPIPQYVQDLPKHDQRQYQADLTADISNRVAYRRNRRQIRKDANQTVAPLADVTIQTAPDINIV